MTDPTAAPNPLQAKIDALEAEKKALADRLGNTDSRISELNGQIQLLIQAAQGQTAAPATEETAPDIVSDPEKAIDFYFQKKAGPILDAKTRVDAQTQRELVALKNPADWKDFGPEVDKLIAEQKLSPQVLSQPGAYDHLLGIVKSKNLDAIVKKKVEAEVAAFQSRAAMASTGGQTDQTGAPVKKDDSGFSDAQLAMLSKLEVDPKEAAELYKKTETDGFRITGPVL